MVSKVCNSSVVISVFLSIILVTNIPSTNGFNITYFLEQHSEYSAFNNLLTQSGVAAAVNKQGTVTVLVVDNSAAASLSGQSPSVIRNVLATHVILDYFDKTKLDNLEGKSAKATNLFQNSGKTSGAQGLLNISNTDGEVVFASDVKGAPRDSKMVKVVASQPFHISVIQISKPIVTPGLDLVAPPPNSPSGSPKAAPPTPASAPSPRKAKGAAPSPAPAPGPADDEDADGPTADSESPAPAPASGPAPGPAPQGDEADKETPAKPVLPKKNGGPRLTAGGAVVSGFVGLVALLAH